MTDWTKYKYSAAILTNCEWCKKEHKMGKAYINRRNDLKQPLLCPSCRMKERYDANKKERKGSFLAALQAKGLNLK